MTEKNLWRITLDTNPEDCNLKCIMCEEHSEYSNFMENLFQATGKKRRVMPSEWLSKIFLEASNLGVKEIIPSTMGEPLLYKNFEEIIELCKKFNLKLNLTTNGTFPKKNVEEWANLILPIATDIKISWNGASKETAEKIMPGIKFERVLENVKELVRKRDELFQNTNYYSKLTFQVTFMENNMFELVGIIKLASELGIDRVKGHHLWSHFKEIEHLSFRKNKESVSKWNEYVKEAHLAQKQFKKKNGTEVILENIITLKEENFEIPENYFCPFLNKELWISATGKISPCCAPDEQRNSLGDFGTIQNRKIEEVMNGFKYKNLVENYKKIPLCKNCNMRKPL